VYRYRFAPDRLRHFRIAADLSRKQLAAACRVTESAVTLWECGYRTPRPQSLIAVAATLGINPVELFVEVDEPVEAVP
jgi:transcriptional regulator with XRE-family HTH domain